MIDTIIVDDEMYTVAEVRDMLEAIKRLSHLEEKMKEALDNYYQKTVK